MPYIATFISQGKHYHLQCLCLGILQLERHWWSPVCWRISNTSML